MQSSRRKRERSENDHHGGGARRRHKPESDESNGSHAELGDNQKNEATAVEVSPHIDETSTNAGQAQPLQDVQTTEGTNGGHDHSEATTTGLSAMDTSNEELRPQESSLWEGTGKGTREEQISALIAHRKILLERMKQCKIAADSRIKRNDEKQKQQQQQDGTNAAADDTASGDAAKPVEGQASTDSEEIQRYQDLCRKAVEANKKQRAPAAEVEKRSSVSLRRGSSVGKRMAAALPSSAPESSSLPAGDMNATIHVGVALSGMEATPSAQLSMPNSKQAALKAAQQRTQAMKAPPAMPQKYGGQQPQRKRSASTSRGMPKSYPGSSSASLAPGTSSLPSHAGTGASGLPFNRLAYPTVNFPEARVLREKRDGIRTKLNALIHERLERIQQTSSANKCDESGVDQLESFASLTEKPSLEEYRLALPRMVLERGVNSPSKLPRRRKTHWDYVLEEMRWLATDFVEERKWKAASARTLASAVVSNRLNAVAPVERRNDDGKAEEENSASGEKNESSSDDNEVRVEVTAEMLEEIGARKYVHPSSSDTQLVHSVAHIMSDMIAEVWTGTVDCGLLANTDEPLMSALVRHNEVRKGVNNRDKPLSDSKTSVSVDETSLQPGTEDDKENGAAATNSDDVEKTTSDDQMESGKEEASSTPLSSDEISEKIDASTDRVKNRTARRNRTKSPREPITLGAGQRRAVEFVEFVWGGEDSLAPCLDGPVASGKTVLSCSLIWKRRCEGPQLLVCSPSRLIRWAYELERFTDLKLFVFGMRCGLSSAIPDAKAHSEFQSGHVVICDFSSLVHLEEGQNKTSLNLASFGTIVMDARFPTECESDISSDGCTKVSRTSSADSLIPPELISHLWWATLLKSLQSCNTKRLLIDNSECRFLNESDDLDRSGLSERQRLDTAAAMTAFVIGPNIFRCSEARSVQHKVVSWAKHFAKEGDERKRPSYGEVRGVIIDASFPFRYRMDPEGDKEDANEHDWDVRLCPLSISQREAYDECCVGVRGALAFGSITDYAEDIKHAPESYQHAVEGLMKLRRVCAHSQIEGVLGRWSATSPAGLTEPSTDITRRARYAQLASSVSQPRADIATDILSGSAKLRELVTILREDCGFTVAEDSVLTHAEVGPEKKMKRKTGKKTTAVRKKVAILAMLPEVQLLVSVLLNAVGIRHKLLGSAPFLGGESNTDTSLSYGSHSDRFARNLDSAMAWIDIQLSLSRFGSSPSETEGDDAPNARTPCEIVITSPFLVGADNGGLGVEAADLVICLDEDWSGRDSVLLERISRKCSFAHAMMNAENGKRNDDGCNLVRLVCEKTCEHVFLSTFDAEDTLSKVDWPTDRRGLLYLPTNIQASDIPEAGDIEPGDESDLEGNFRFPASSVLRFRGKVLSDVLLPTNHIPPDFATGDAIRFLPFQDWEDNSKGRKSLSAELVRSLIIEERRAIQSFWRLSVGGEGTSHGSSIEADAIAVPPFPADFPSTVMTRHDMMAVSSRLYVDRTGRRLARMGGSGLPSDSIQGQLAGPSLTSSAITGDNGRLMDAWHKNGLSCKPGDLVPSLLSYSADDVPPLTGSETDKGVRNEANLTNEKASPGEPMPLTVSTTARKNVFSASYGSSRQVVSNVVRDGNQGFEPLAYFPPLFPTLLSASDRAQADAAERAFQGGPTSSAEYNIMPNIMLEPDLGQGKRKEPTVAYPVFASKRPRLDKVPTITKAAQPSSTLPPHDMIMPPARLGPSGVTSSDGYARRMDSSVVTEDESSQWDQSSFLFDMGEDYGLLGVGALSSDIDSSRQASMVSVDALGYTRWVDPYEPDGLDHAIFSSTIPCDTEEIEAYVRGETDDSFLDTMLLFVAKQAPSGFGGISGTSTASQLGGLNFPCANSAWHPSRAAIPAPSVADALAGPDGTKKGKRKSQSQAGMPVGAFARVNPADFSNRSMNPYGASSALQSNKGRESYRSKILASILARQGGGRASLFQVPSFLLASIRIRDDVLRRVLSHSQESSMVRQVSYSSRQPWTRACYKLNSSTKQQTGDSALQVSKNQQIKMLTAPAPVDFGPFVAGYISSPNAACGAVPRAAATGISLPMGVKIPRRSGEQQMQGWTALEDKKLKDSVLRYGANWHLVAAAVDNVDEELQSDSTKDVTLFHTPSRSPGQCHERWSRLVYLDPDLASTLRSAERSRYIKAVSHPPPSSEIESENSSRRLNKKPATQMFAVSKADDAISLILPSDMFVEKDGDEIMSDGQAKADTKVRGKRSFAALRGATKKKIEVTLPIPGSVNGEKPSLVPSHPSHAQAVQAAIAGTSGGKPEMWPLQILDLADKHWAARNASVSSPNRHQAVGAAIPPSAQMRSPGHQHASNRQPRPHASFQVPRASLASPPRNPPPNAGHRQGYPAVATNGGPGPVRGPPPPSGQPR